MPQSYADQLHDTETILKAVSDTEAELPGCSFCKAALGRAYAQAAEAKAQREAWSSPPTCQK